MAAPVVIGPNSASVIPTADQYKLLIEMVKINPQLFWYNQEPNMFLSGLESVLELSPILHTHWITFMLIMIINPFIALLMDYIVIYNKRCYHIN